MKIVEIAPFTIYGLSVTTNNMDEQDQSSAKIGKLWQDFFLLFPPDAEKKHYGVYSNYLCDEKSNYDLLVGSRDNTKDQNLDEISIRGGKYLRFDAEGNLPQAAIELWQKIWGSFQNENMPLRLFETDFEEYTSERSISIYIGIKDKEKADEK